MAQLVFNLKNMALKCLKYIFYVGWGGGGSESEENNFIVDSTVGINNLHLHRRVSYIHRVCCKLGLLMFL
jgi:hypothetical protein